MIRRILGLILLAGLCSSCGLKGPNHGAVDLTKLQDSEAKYGVVVFRSMYFGNEEQEGKFIQNDNTLILTGYDESAFYAKKYAEDKSGVFYFGYQIGGNSWGSDEAKEKEKRFEKTPRKAGGISSGTLFTMATYYPEFFYTVKMLLEGDYYVSRIQAGGYDRYYNQKETPYHFSVKAGHINYLGDLYLSNPKRDEGFFSNTYSLNVNLLDESNEVRVFLVKYHPEINLPFAVNLIQRSSR